LLGVARGTRRAFSRKGRGREGKTSQTPAKCKRRERAKNLRTKKKSGDFASEPREVLFEKKPGEDSSI